MNLKIITLIPVSIALVSMALLNPKKTSTNKRSFTPELIFADKGNKTKKPSTSAALLVKENIGDSASVPLQISDLAIDVKVIANVSITTMDFTFYNQFNRTLEGQFCFPLGEGQSITGFAMDMNGVMREGSVVEKEKGREVFESIERQRIDPALLEWTKGNNFKMRIFPIPAKGNKRIKLSFEQELISTPSDYIYQLPLSFNQSIKNYSVKAEVVGNELNNGDGKGSGFGSNDWQNNLRAEKKLINYKPNELFSFSIPKKENTNRCLVEPTEKGNGSGYFYLTLDPEKVMRAKKLPEKICLLWDASGSASMRDIAKEKEILDTYFKRIQNLQVELITFSNCIHSDANFSISNGNWKELEAAIDKVIYDGGTQLGAIDLKKYTCNEFILCSDGLSNFGNNEFQFSNTPVITLTSAQSADHSYLKYIAQASNGHYINALSNSPIEALAALSTESFRFLSATSNKQEITQVYPSIPSDFNTSFSLAGIIKTPEAEITLNFGIGNEILYSKKVTIKNETNTREKYIGKLWAQKKIDELDIQFEKNIDEITRLGKKFSKITRNTSLLVLERLQDYIQYKVMPTDENLKKEYLTFIEREEQNLNKSTYNHSEEVVRLYNEKLKWWNTDFKPEQKTSIGKKKVEDSIRSVNVRGNAGNEGLINDRDNLEEVVVTALSITREKKSLSYSTQTISGERLETFDSEDLFKSSDKEKGNSNYNAKPKITLKNWDSDMPYMDDLKDSPADELYFTYLDLKKQYKSLPSFFLDAANYLMEKGQKENGLRVLSNLAEFELENHEILRVLAHRLQQTGHLELAIASFREILKIRGEEPQSYRDLGLALAENKQYQEAVNILSKVVNRRWDSRFPEIEVLVASEINAIAAESGNKVQLDSIDHRLRKAMPTDVRVVINWDTDNCDMDLWVKDPNSETCLFSHSRTSSGGYISRDFTGGYGPEEFLIKRAIPGKYLIQVNYYGNSRQSLMGPTTVQAELYTNYGKSNQQKKQITLRLKQNKEVVDIGELVFNRL